MDSNNHSELYTAIGEHRKSRFPESFDAATTYVNCLEARYSILIRHLRVVSLTGSTLGPTTDHSVREPGHKFALHRAL